MPPKVKYTKFEITNAALDIVRKNGLEALTARSLGEKLGVSTRPVFTAFQNMEELQECVLKAAKDFYKNYINKAVAKEMSFKNVGKQYIRFAVEESNLFKCLFMKEQINKPSLNAILPLIEIQYDRILHSVQDDYNVDFETAKTLYYHIWIYTHGIAVLCATKICVFTEDEITEMVAQVFQSLLVQARSHKLKNIKD